MKSVLLISFSMKLAQLWECLLFPGFIDLPDILLLKLALDMKANIVLFYPFTCFYFLNTTETLT